MLRVLHLLLRVSLVLLLGLTLLANSVQSHNPRCVLLVFGASLLISQVLLLPGRWSSAAAVQGGAPGKPRARHKRMNLLKKPFALSRLFGYISAPRRTRLVRRDPVKCPSG